MTQKTFDLVVIGGGPGGYAAAIKGSQRGLSVALVEKRSQGHLGGTCLNVGCIPTKFLLEKAKVWHQLRSLEKQGFHAENLSYNWEHILTQKNKLLDKQRRGLDYLMKKHGIHVFEGHGSFEDKTLPHQNPLSSYHICINLSNPQPASESRLLIQGKNVIIATGSTIRSLPHLQTQDLPLVYNSDEILDIAHPPSHLVIVGGGVIGIEFASLFAMMGSQVTIIEAQEHLLAEFDRDCVVELIKQWRGWPITLLTNTTIEELTPQEGQLIATAKTHKDKSSHRISCTAALLAVGRTPVTSELNLKALGISVDKQGFIPVSEFCETQAQGVYAIGDVIATPALAHTATAEGLSAVDHLTQHSREPLNYNHNPLAVYSYPELASVGHREEDLRRANIPYKVCKTPFSIMAKATIEGYPEGFIKLLFHPESSEILGAHLIGGKATELVSEFVLGQSLETTVEEFAHSIRPHPTLSESLSEVALSGLGEPLHAP